jgi:hypothetical protein
MVEDGSRASPAAVPRPPQGPSGADGLARRSMGDLEAGVLTLIAAAGLVGAVALAALGFLTLLAARGGGGDVMWMLAALSVAIGELLLALVVIVPAVLVLRAVSILRGPGSLRSPARPRDRVIAGLAAGAVLLAWMAPAALTFSSGSPASVDVTFSTIAIGIGLVEAAAAFAAFGLLHRPLGMAMLIIPLLSVSMPLWVSSSRAEQQAHLARSEAQMAAERAHFEERFAEILQGPTVEELAAQVGDVGDWRLLGGGVTPMERGDRQLDRQEVLTDLGGAGVRFALVAQCTADFDGGELVGATTVFGLRRAGGEPLDANSLESPVVPCDGRLHLEVSDAVALPAWDAATLAGAGRDWALVMSYVVVDATAPVASRRSEMIYPDSGVRWLIFVAPEPAPSADPLLATMAAHLAPLRPR